MLADPYLSDLMREYGFSIVGVQTAGSGAGRLHDILLRIHRDVVCELCGQPFGYGFQVVVDGTVRRGRRTLDVAMVTPKVEHELRRRIRCPHCRAVQHRVRRVFVHREIHHGIVGLSALGGTLVGAATLSIGGYMLAGFMGLLIGLGLSIALVLTLTRWMLGELIDSVPRDRRPGR
jgi:hypothetical protein